MKFNRQWFIPLIVIGGLLFTYLGIPFLMRGIDAVLSGVMLGISFSMALPQAFWWGIGAGVLVIAGIQVLIVLGNKTFSRAKTIKEEKGQGGRFRVIHKILARSDSVYYRGEARDILRSLATDLIALKLNLSAEEAAERFNRGDWTEDRTLLAYFYEMPELVLKKREFGGQLKKLKPAAFLEEVQKVLAHLKEYGDFPDGRERVELANSNH